MTTKFEKKAKSLIPDLAASRKNYEAAESKETEASSLAYKNGSALDSSMKGFNKRQNALHQNMAFEIAAKELPSLFNSVKSSFGEYIKACSAFSKAHSEKKKAMQEMQDRQKVVQDLLKTINGG